MPHYNFSKDFPIARETEKEVALLLMSLYGAEILEDKNPDARYDIRARINGAEFTFEVKEDFIGENTGNVGLETSCRGKPSGIRTSQADFYIYKLHTREGNLFVLHRTDVLKKKIADRKYRRIVDGGDKGSHSINYLFRRREFLEGGRVLAIDKSS